MATSQIFGGKQSAVFTFPNDQEDKVPTGRGSLVLNWNTVGTAHTPSGPNLTPTNERLLCKLLSASCPA